MWTKEHRARQAAFERRRYPTDLTDEEWERIRPLLPRPAKRGRRPSVDGSARDPQRHPPAGAGRLRLAHAAARLPVLADGALVVPALRPSAPVPHRPRRRADARPRAGWASPEPERRGAGQPDR